MCFSGLKTLIFTLEFGNNWVLCQINWVSIPKFLKIIEYLLKTFGYFTQILLLSLALLLFCLSCSVKLKSFFTHYNHEDFSTFSSMKGPARCLLKSSMNPCSFKTKHSVQKRLSISNQGQEYSLIPEIRKKTIVTL